MTTGCSRKLCKHGWLMRFDNCPACKADRKVLDPKWLRYEPAEDADA